MMASLLAGVNGDEQLRVKALEGDQGAAAMNVRVCVLAARGNLPRLDHNPVWGDRSDWYVAYGVAAISGRIAGDIAYCDVQNDRLSARWDTCCQDFDTTTAATLRFELFDDNLMDDDVLCCSAEMEVRPGYSTLVLGGGADRYLDVHVTLAAPPPPSLPSPPPPSPPPLPPQCDLLVVGAAGSTVRLAGTSDLATFARELTVAIPPSEAPIELADVATLLLRGGTCDRLALALQPPGPLSLRAGSDGVPLLVLPASVRASASCRVRARFVSPGWVTGAVGEPQVTVRVDRYTLGTSVHLRLFRNGSLALALADATSAVGDVEVGIVLPATHLGQGAATTWLTNVLEPAVRRRRTCGGGRSGRCACTGGGCAWRLAPRVLPYSRARLCRWRHRSSRRSRAPCRKWRSPPTSRSRPPTPPTLTHPPSPPTLLPHPPSPPPSAPRRWRGSSSSF